MDIKVTKLADVWRQEFSDAPVDAGDIMANPSERGVGRGYAVAQSGQSAARCAAYCL